MEAITLKVKSMATTYTHAGHGVETGAKGIRGSLGESRIAAGNLQARPETSSTRHQRKGGDSARESIAQNLAYGVGTAAVTLIPLVVPGIGYLDVALGLTAVSLAVFLAVALIGVFRGLLPPGRRAKGGRRRRG